jgi:IclR family acetate operon transcriptional repressor
MDRDVRPPARGRYGCSMVNVERDPRDDYVQSVDRALSIMGILARDGWSGVTDIADELGVNKSTIFRLMFTLKRRGFVEQHRDSHKYRLGIAVTQLAGAVRSQLDIVQLARPVAERLSEGTREPVILATLEDGEVVNLGQVDLSSSALTVNWSGRRTAVHATSTGKALLAFSPAAVVDRHVAGTLQAFTPKTVTVGAQLREQLAKARRDGYAFTVEELEEGLNAVSAPILDGSGTAVAALCVTGPAFRLTEARIHELGPEVVEAATEISRAIGFVGELAHPPRVHM